MKIHGIQKMTLVDYPGLVACILFSGGCNFRCPYCHNGELVLRPDDFPIIAEEDIFSFLKKRVGVLDGVVVSGGEPTLEKDLPDFLRKIKDLGFLVKLDTNGSNPEMLKAVVSSHLVDYVAMDIKNSFDRYGLTIGIPSFDTFRVEESIDYLLSGVVDYEFRTTVTREYHDEKSFEQLASRLAGCRNYYIQNFMANENTIKKINSPCTHEQLQTYMGILSKTINNVQIRNE